MRPTARHVVPVVGSTCRKRYRFVPCCIFQYPKSSLFLTMSCSFTRQRKGRTTTNVRDIWCQYESSLHKHLHLLHLLPLLFLLFLPESSMGAANFDEPLTGFKFKATELISYHSPWSFSTWQHGSNRSAIGHFQWKSSTSGATGY